VAQARQEIEGPGGFRLLLVRTGEETGNELLEMEASYAGNGDLPPAHLHPKQVESFEVLEGSVRTVIAGAQRAYAAGESFEVPAATPHQMTADVPARVRWQVRPALRTAEFFERLYAALAGAGEEGVDLLEEYSDEFRLVSGE
jgi:mannose-6-phosphate isomerase-like protein (cupin superfamily)